MRRTLTYSLAGLLGLPLIGVFLFATLQPIKVLPRLRLAPGFALTDQDGRTVSSDDLRGKITLYTFTYTRCMDPCQDPTALLREVQAALAEPDLRDAPIQLVTITVDSERDTPAALRAFGEAVGADFARWTFLTGDEVRLRQAVMGGFDVLYRPLPDGSLDLDTRLWLADGWGILRAEYAQYLPTTARLLRDLRLVAAETRNSEGLAKYAYEAAHLFGCYSE